MALPSKPAAMTLSDAAVVAGWRTRVRCPSLHGFDWLGLGFPTLVGALMVLATSGAERLYYVALHLAYLAFGLGVICLGQRHPGNSWLFGTRLGYASFLLIVTFMEIGQLQALLHRDYWLTGPLIELERAIFGVHPPLWVARLYRPWLNELMAFFHLAYFTMPFWPAVPAIRARRHGEVLNAMSLVLFTYVVTYSLFLVLPAMNPRMSAELGPDYVAPQAGYLFFSLEHALQGDTGTVAGNCFPSAHASGATAWLWLSASLHGFKHPATWINALFALGTSAATVYLGFHHALDPLMGIVLSAACCTLGVAWLRGKRIAHSAHP